MTRDPLKAATGLSLGGLLVLFSLHGEAFWRGALGAWNFLLVITKTAPMGLASFFAALLLGTLLCIALKRGVPPSANAHARGFWIETLVGIVAMAVAWLQVRGMSGLLFGAFAGLLAPYTAKGAMGVATWVGQMLRTEPEP